jgi:hypothetical protein
MVLLAAATLVHVRDPSAVAQGGGAEVPQFWFTTASGEVAGSPSLGSLARTALAAPIVGISSTPDRRGYWLVGADGGVFSFGDASYYGSLPAQHRDLAAPVVGMAPTPDGKGYWLFGRDGGVFAFGDAPFLGSAAGLHLAAPIAGGAAAPDGLGYWLVGADGGVFTFGAAGFHGSAQPFHLSAPTVGITPTAAGGGYWLTAADGGVFTFGDASFDGSGAGSGRSNVIGPLVASADGAGYWLPTAVDAAACVAFGDVTPTSQSGSPDGACVTSTGTPPEPVPDVYVGATTAGFRAA